MDVSQVTWEQYCQLPFYYQERFLSPLIPVKQGAGMLQWLEEKLNNGGYGIVLGDTFIGKTATAIRFAHQHCSVESFINGSIPVYLFDPGRQSTYKTCLIKLIQHYEPWIKLCKGDVESCWKKSTVFLESWARELLIAAGTALIIVDEPNRISIKVLEKLLTFLDRVPQLRSIVAIGYTPAICHVLKQPVYERFRDDQYIYENLTQTEATEFAQGYFAGSEFATFDWTSPLGQSALAAGDGYAGMLCRIFSDTIHAVKANSVANEDTVLEAFSQALEEVAYEIRRSQGSILNDEISPERNSVCPHPQRSGVG